MVIASYAPPDLPPDLARAEVVIASNLIIDDRGKIRFFDLLDTTSFDAKLVIGNEAMLHASMPVQYSYDLGDLWMRKTGHPVVFAVFVVHRKFAKENKEQIEIVFESYRKSLLELERNRETVIKCASEKYPDIDYDINKYYELLKYNFSDELKKALQFYFDSAGFLGLLNKVEKLDFL